MEGYTLKQIYTINNILHVNLCTLPLRNCEEHVVGISLVQRLSLAANVNPSILLNSEPILTMVCIIHVHVYVYIYVLIIGWQHNIYCTSNQLH